MTPPLAEIAATARVVALPMNTRFRGVDVREALLFEGPQGWAEFSPFVEYEDAEATTWLHAAIDFAWNVQPAAVRDRVPVNATVPAVEAARVAEVLARFGGCRTAKVKVAERGQTLSDDIARVRAVREAMGADGRIRIDANGGWNLDEAETAIHALAEFDLEYAEQPCTAVEELAELRYRVKHKGIPIAADESIRKAADPLAVAQAKAADLIVVKAQPLGGIRRALSIVADAGLPAVVSSALDTAIGLSQGAALAASLPELDYDCGLGTASLFADDVADARPMGGAVSAARVIPDAAALTRLEAPTERREWWLARLERCHALLPD
ncbi:o-succinylbenzoate synthase [Microbacterium sp. ARD32]|uniref:o-succinylbenzoate synthase n=1 Tax=Microbacterium sp. ARD32 TaxID=2962577 RepID=UPI0028811065|nr:o-succinylbenzoate synthase [Microbacterium sp. ARD32]MDT0156288.1 o-succinylbenzoate synthase [Microbacterium sp. ARD32]